MPTRGAAAARPGTARPQGGGGGRRAEWGWWRMPTRGAAWRLNMRMPDETGEQKKIRGSVTWTT